MATVTWCFEYQFLGLLSGGHPGGPCIGDYAVSEVGGSSANRPRATREHVEGYNDSSSLQLRTDLFSHLV